MIALVAAGLLGISAPADESVHVHQVKRGESLWTIAADVIGDPSLWPAIYRANRDQIKDPQLLYPGQRLTIPEIDRAEREAVRRESKTLLSK